MDETPDYTEDSDTNPNTTASSVAGDPLTADGRKRRSEATQLRRSVFGKKHDRLGESKVCAYCLHSSSDLIVSQRLAHTGILIVLSNSRKMILFADLDTSLA